MPDDVKTEDAYRPPSNSDAPPPSLAGDGPRYYVVSQQKALMLYVATLGAYAFYWFYKNWLNYRAATRENLSPFWRACFSIFFVHKLFGFMDADAERAGRRVDWNASNMATIYVVGSIASQVLSRLSGPEDVGGIDAAAFVIGLGMAYPLVIAQRAANVASDDPDGDSNSQLNAGNFAWMALGALLWLLILSAMFLPNALV